MKQCVHDFAGDCAQQAIQKLIEEGWLVKTMVTYNSGFGHNRILVVFQQPNQEELP